MWFAGPGFVCTGDAEKDNYDGTMFRPVDMKHVTQNFYKTKRRYAQAKKQNKDAKALQTPAIFELGWAHPGNDTRTGRIGEFKETYVDDRKRQIVIGRINAATLKGKELTQRLKNSEPVGISFDTVFKQMGEGESSRIVSKSVTGVSLVDNPAHHQTGTFIEHYADSEEELYRKLFPETPMGGIGVEGLTTDARKRPLFVPKALRSHVSRLAKIRIPSNAMKMSPDDDDDDDDEDAVEEEPGKEKASAEEKKQKTPEKEDKGAEEKGANEAGADKSKTEKKKKTEKKTESNNEDAMDIDQEDLQESPPKTTDGKQKASDDASKKKKKKKQQQDSKQDDPMDVDVEKSADATTATTTKKKNASTGGEAVFDDSSVSKQRKGHASNSSSAANSAATESELRNVESPSEKRKTQTPSPKQQQPKKGMSANNNSKKSAGGDKGGDATPSPRNPGALNKRPAGNAVPPPLSKKRERDEEEVDNDEIEVDDDNGADEEMENNNHEEDDGEGESDEMDTTPPPPMPVKKPFLKRTHENDNQPSAKSHRSSSDTNASYKMTNDDVKQQIESTMETTKEYFDMLGIETPEQRDAFIQAQLRKKAQKALAEQRQALTVMENMLAETNADEETQSKFNTLTQQLMQGKHGPELAEYAKVMAAAAASHGSSAPSHLSVEAEYQRQKKGGSSSSSNKGNTREKTRNIEAKAGISFGQRPNRGELNLTSGSNRWGSDFFNSTFSSRSVTNGGLAVKKGGGGFQNASSDDHFKSSRERSLPSGFVTPTIKNLQQKPSRITSSEDAMDIDDQMGADGEGEDARIDLLRVPDIGFKFVGKRSAQGFVSTLPKEIKTYRPDPFDFDKIQSHMTPNGYMHHVATAIMYPDRKMELNPAMRDIFTDQSSFYNQADTPSGYIPRIIKGGKAIIVAENDNE